MRPGSPTNIAYFRAGNNEKGLKTEAFPHFRADAQTEFLSRLRLAKWLSQPSLSDILRRYSALDFTTAGVVKLADARDSKSRGVHAP
jgi:hypothetical protein